MEPATDVIANELAIRLFLFGLAALSFYEALKLEKPRNYVAWVAMLLFLASGLALTPISNAWPLGVAWMGELVSAPLTWFVLVAMLYLIIRPRWSLAPNSSVGGGQSMPVAAVDDPVLGKRVDELDRMHKVIIGDYQDVSAKLAKSDEAIIAIREEVAFLPPMREAMSQRLSKIDSELENIRILADTILAERRSQAKASLEKDIEALDHIIEHPGLTYSTHVRLTESAIKALNALGCPTDEIRQEIEARKNAIKTDNEFILVHPHEAEQWSTGAQKRSWHEQRAATFVYRSLMSKYDPAKPISDVELLNKIYKVQ